MGEFVEKMFVDVWWCRGFGVLGKSEVNWGRGEKPSKDDGVQVFVFHDLEFKFTVELALKVNAEIVVRAYSRWREEDTIVGAGKVSDFLE